MAKRKKPIELLDDGETRALIRAVDHNRYPQRDTALLTLLRGAGLRISEALALRPVDLSIKDKPLVRILGKGKFQLHPRMH